MGIKVGDWIRYRCGWRQAVVIDVVLYVREQDRYPRKMEAVTNHNIVAFDEVLEIRGEMNGKVPETPRVSGRQTPD